MTLNVFVMELALLGAAKIGGILPVAYSISSWHDVASNLLFMSSAVNGASWTLKIELEAIPFSLIAYFCHKRWGNLAISFVASIGVIALFSEGDVITNSIREFLFMFYLGMLVAGLGTGNFAARFMHCLTPFGCVLSILFLLGARLLISYTSKWAILIEGVAGAYMVAALAFGRPWLAHRLLGLPPVRWLGRVSYSLYLYHPLALPFAIFGFAWAGTPPGHVLTAAKFAGLTLCLVLPMAWAGYGFVEVPIGDFSRKLLRGGLPLRFVPSV